MKVQTSKCWRDAGGKFPASAEKLPVQATQHGHWSKVCERLEMDENTAQRLRQIAGNERLANPAHRAKVPASRTLCRG